MEQVCVVILPAPPRPALPPGAAWVSLGIRRRLEQLQPLLCCLELFPQPSHLLGPLRHLLPCCGQLGDDGRKPRRPISGERLGSLQLGRCYGRYVPVRASRSATRLPSLIQRRTVLMLTPSAVAA